MPAAGLTALAPSSPPTITIPLGQFYFYLIDAVSDSTYIINSTAFMQDLPPGTTLERANTSSKESWTTTDETELEG